MKLHELQYTEGSRQNDYRRGRGIGSGNGKTAGKGHKGQNARSGGGVAIGFEGGQMPLWRRLPKRGFKNVNRVEYAVVNVNDLNRFDEGTCYSRRGWKRPPHHNLSSTLPTAKRRLDYGYPGPARNRRARYGRRYRRNFF